jgi:nucleotide-binding universal stress UspA family protein
MFETILVPLDGSQLAEAALPYATELKAKFGSRLLLVRVIESAGQRLTQGTGLLESPAVVAADLEVTEKIVEAEREQATAYLGEQLQKPGSGSDVETLIVDGHAAAAIIDVATERNVSLIVVSSHGRSGLGRLVYGSVADAVLRESKVPVLVVRPAAE